MEVRPWALPSHNMRLLYACQGAVESSKDSLKRRNRLPRDYSVKRLCMLMLVFQRGLQGDISSARQHRTDSASMCSAEPVLEFVSILSKYGHFQELLVCCVDT
jgi:hypothetical protein